MKYIVLLMFCLLVWEVQAQTTQPEILTNASIITMKKMKFSIGVIKNKINNTQCNFTTDINALAELKTAGVDDDIIEVMVSKASVSSTPATNNPDNKGSGGVLSADNKRYTTSTGKLYRVGEPVHINVGSGPETGEFKYITEDHGSVIRFLGNDKPMKLEYGSQLYVIKKIYSVKSAVTDVFVKNAPRTVFIVFETSRNNAFKIAIEAALQAKEVLPN